MRQVTCPSRAPLADFDRVVQHRRDAATRESLGEARALIAQAYSEYRSSYSFRSPMELEDRWPGISSILKTNFRHLEKGGCLEELRYQLLAASRGKCPICDISAPFSLDHYLPKRSFPEFAVFVENLVPVCERCNSLKGVSTGIGTGRWLHMYYDPIDSFGFLHCEVETSARPPVRYSLVLDDSCPADLRDAIAGTFEGLDLFARYAVEAATELSAQSNVFRELRGRLGGEGWRQVLAVAAESYSSRLGRNHWRTSLYLSLSRLTR
jgi:hypothetical protein